jgi:hypothetical protein
MFLMRRNSKGTAGPQHQHASLGAAALLFVALGLASLFFCNLRASKGTGSSVGGGTRRGKGASASDAELIEWVRNSGGEVRAYVALNW